MLAGSLLMAGTDTTRNQLAASVQVLCDHPDQWALLAERPELAANAVEETMRHPRSPIPSLRTAVEDVELGGSSSRPARRPCQHRRGQPRSGRLRGSRPLRHHPRDPPAC